ncbi:unnamed protein product, partial [Gulo gulo]
MWYLCTHALLQPPHMGVEGLFLCQVHFLLGYPVLPRSPSMPPAQHQLNSGSPLSPLAPEQQAFLQ